MVFITVLSLVSGISVSNDSVQIIPLDKLAHFTFYFFAVVLGLQSWREFRGVTYNSTELIVSVLSATIYGMIIEAFQYAFTTDRSAEWSDIWANVLGALSGAFLAMSWKDKIWALKTRF